MADFEGALPVKTARDDDVKIKIVDFSSGESATAGLNIDSNGAALVRAVSLDIRPIVAATDSITVEGSVTVSATDLDIRDLVFATDKVDVSGSTVTVTATDLDIRALTFATDKVDVSGSTVTVTATALDTRDLTAARDTVKISDGTDLLAINADGSLNVSLVPGAKAQVNAYGTAVVNKNATHNFDYTIPSGQTFEGVSVLVGCRGAIRVEYGIFDGVTFSPLGVYFQLPASNSDILISNVRIVGDGDLILRVTVTNLDNSGDVYATIKGFNLPT